MLSKRRLTSSTLAGSSQAGFSHAQLPAVFELLSRVATAAVATVGGDCEVVVHDLRQPEHSVVAISGGLTGRQVGAPVPDPELMPGVVDRFTSDDLRRQTRTQKGRDLLSSTSWVRDADGHVVGAICINIDRADLRRARDLIDQHLVAPDVPGATPTETFAADISQFASVATRQAVGGVRPSHRRTREELVSILRDLDHAGVFSLRGAARTVAAELGLSRATVYEYLRDARAQVAPKDNGAHQGRRVRLQSGGKSNRIRPGLPA
ncbi:MAG TPA: PAS domain-containing protein [Candidatus Sulfotelmatobacter sp.]|nr:PAS domain-containing protein [Candidatus Sulfotelmatobacter sp.]